MPGEGYRIRITPRAAEGLVEICAFIERDSPQNAAKVAQELLDAIDSLALFPRRYKVHEHRRDPSKTVHAMPVPPSRRSRRVLLLPARYPSGDCRRTSKARCLST